MKKLLKEIKNSNEKKLFKKLIVNFLFDLKFNFKRLNFNFFYLLLLCFCVTIFFHCESDTSSNIKKQQEQKNKEDRNQDDKKDGEVNIPPNPNNDRAIQYDPLFKDQWHLKNTGQLYDWYIKKYGKDNRKNKIGIDINVQKVWQKGYLGQGMFVGVLDSHIDNKHPDLKENLLSKNIVHYYPLRECEDMDHGSGVAAIIAARDNGVGMQGIAPRATLYSYAVIPGGDDRKFNKDASIYLEIFSKSESQKIAVYNGSLGYSIASNYHYSTTLTEAMNKVTQKGFYGKGSSLVFSAGNLGKVHGSANETFLNHYAVIGVNSLYEDGDIADPIGESSIGPNIWMVAPSSVTSAKSTTCNENSEDENSKYFKKITATSSAAPMVSGAIALLRQAYSQLTWRDVKLILAESANKIEFEDFKSPRLKFKQSGVMVYDKTKKQFYSRVAGFGLVDVVAAFNLAAKWQLLPPMKTFTSPIQNQPLTVKYDNVFRESSLTIENSGIDYIESIEVKINFDMPEQIIFTLSSLYLVSPQGLERAIFSGDLYYHGSATVNQKTVYYLLNAFLGSKLDGIWKLKIKLYNGTDANRRIRAIKSWNLIVRGH